MLFCFLSTWVSRDDKTIWPINDCACPRKEKKMDAIKIFTRKQICRHNTGSSSHVLFQISYQMWQTPNFLCKAQHSVLTALKVHSNTRSRGRSDYQIFFLCKQLFIETTFRQNDFFIKMSVYQNDFLIKKNFFSLKRQSIKKNDVLSKLLVIGGTFDQMTFY